MQAGDVSFTYIFKLFASTRTHIPPYSSLTHSRTPRERHAETTKDLVNLEGRHYRTEVFRLCVRECNSGMPDRPPFETAAVLVMAPVDQLAEIFQQWPEDDVNPISSLEQDYMVPLG